MEESAFWYVDGIPTKGCWIDMDSIDGTDEVLEELAEKGIIPRNEDGEPEYEGDLLVADTEGILAGIALGSYGSFDFDLFVKLRDSGMEPEILEAWNHCFGLFPDDMRTIEENYWGHYDSWEDMAKSLLEDTGELNSIPENLRYYFDYEKYARDLRIGGDFSMYNNEFFWSDWK